MSNPLSAQLEAYLVQTKEHQAVVTVPRKLLFRIAAELKLREQVEREPRREPTEDKQPDNVHG